MFSYAFPLLFLCFSHAFPMLFLCFSYSLAMLSQYFSYGLAMVWLWFPMLILCFPYAFHWSEAGGSAPPRTAHILLLGVRMEGGAGSGSRVSPSVRASVRILVTFFAIFLL